MKSASLALAVVLLLGLPAPLLAQDTKMARGTASVVAEDSLTVKTPDGERKFVVDSKTTVEAIGAGTKTRQAQAAGQAGPKLTEVLKVGQPVAVSYSESGGTMRALSIRAISSVGAAPGAAAATAGAKTSNGKVKAVSATSMTVTGSGGGGATFDQTFTIDGTTKVVGRGAGTAAAAAGGKTAITELVGTGDTVSVTYHQAGSGLHAAEVRVTAKAAAK